MLRRLLASVIKEGALSVRGPDGKIISIGVAESQPPVLVHIHDYGTLARIARNPALAVGEAYMDGTLTIERGSLYDFLALATRNLFKSGRRRRASDWLRRMHRNSRRTARRNVAHHYDLSGDLYRLFLDPDRQYSCAYFPEAGMSLEAAQIAKKRHLAAKLLLAPGQHVLDIGSGWGGLALTLAQEHGVSVTGVTLSMEQFAESQNRAAEARLADSVRFALQDYRDVQGRFDRIVSVGMFEHVGPAHYQTFFDTIRRLLTDDGVAVLHTIGLVDGPSIGNPWIEKYIFPGGTLPSLSQITPAVERSGLFLTDVEILRLHYAETLRQWRQRFAEHREGARALYDERFCRMWEFYLAGAEAGFREGSLVVFQFQLAKDRRSVPLTRDYITDFDRARRSASLAVAAE